MKLANLKTAFSAVVALVLAGVITVGDIVVTAVQSAVDFCFCRNNGHNGSGAKTAMVFSADPKRRVRMGFFAIIWLAMTLWYPAMASEHGGENSRSCQYEMTTLKLRGENGTHATIHINRCGRCELKIDVDMVIIHEHENSLPIRFAAKGALWTTNIMGIPEHLALILPPEGDPSGDEIRNYLEGAQVVGGAVLAALQEKKIQFQLSCEAEIRAGCE